MGISPSHWDRNLGTILFFGSSFRLQGFYCRYHFSIPWHTAYRDYLTAPKFTLLWIVPTDLGYTVEHSTLALFLFWHPSAICTQISGIPSITRTPTLTRIRIIPLLYRNLAKLRSHDLQLAVPMSFVFRNTSSLSFSTSTSSCGQCYLLQSHWLCHPQNQVIYRSSGSQETDLLPSSS